MHVSDIISGSRGLYVWKRQTQTHAHTLTHTHTHTHSSTQTFTCTGSSFYIKWQK